MVKKLQPQPIYGPEDIGTPINLDNLMSAITTSCHELGLPVEVYKDEMREGGMFSNKLPCIVVRNKNHRSSYFQHVIVQKTLFNSCHITVYLAGKSANLNKMGYADAASIIRTDNARLYGATGGKKGRWMPTFTEVVVGLSGKSAARKFNDQEKPYYERVEYAIGYSLPRARTMPVEPPKPPVDHKPPVQENRGGSTGSKTVSGGSTGSKTTTGSTTGTGSKTVTGGGTKTSGVTPRPTPPQPPKKEIPKQEPPKPKASSKIIGIDLGTTNSCVAVWEAGEPVMIPGKDGCRLTPSVVAFGKDGKRVVGQAAKNQLAANPKRTVSSIKRQMGSAYRFDADGQWFNPQQISAMILSKLKADAEDYLGERVDKAVITVPAYFTNEQRQATKDAGEIAGLNVLRIINEPTAAALAYGLNKDIDQTVMVYDLGGGTFDVSILKIGDGVTEVMATAGDNHLGGDDFDRCLVDYMLQQFQKENGIDLYGDLVAMYRMKDAAEKAKIELSTLHSARIELPYIYNHSTRGPMHLSVTITRDQFNVMIAEMVQRTMDITRQVLADADLAANKVNKVLLVGGSTRVPAVQEAVRNLMGDNLVKQLNPDECVALGAAVQGAVLSGNETNTLLLDVLPISLGVETHGGAYVKVLEKNTSIPVSNTRTFTTYAENQTSVEIRVFQGDEKDVADNKFLGCFQLGGIAPMKGGVPKIEVTFSVDGNGILKVSAVDAATGRANSITVTDSSNMSRAAVERAARDARRYESTHPVR